MRRAQRSESCGLHDHDGSGRSTLMEAFGWLTWVTFEFAGVDVEPGVPTGVVVVPAHSPRGGRSGSAARGGGSASRALSGGRSIDGLVVREGRR